MRLSIDKDEEIDRFRLGADVDIMRFSLKRSSKDDYRDRPFKLIMRRDVLSTDYPDEKALFYQSTVTARF